MNICIAYYIYLFGLVSLALARIYLLCCAHHAYFMNVAIALAGCATHYTPQSRAGVVYTLARDPFLSFAFILFIH